MASRYCQALTREREGSTGSALHKILMAVRCHHALLSLPEVYHPLLVPGLDYLTPKRPCSDRLQLIITDLDAPPGVVNDIGCQIGFFSFSLAEKGYNVTGYDMETRNIDICRMLQQLKEPHPKPEFKKLELSPENVDRFQTADYTICLAVFHHIIYYRGLATARELLRVLRKTTRQRLYFEIGQSNESVNPWSSCLPDMGRDPLNWIAEFLGDGGFKDVHVLGLVPTHLSNVLRYLVSAA